MQTPGDELLRNYIINSLADVKYVKGGRHEIEHGGLCCYGLVRRIAQLRGFDLPIKQADLLRRKAELAERIGLDVRLRFGDVVVCDPITDAGQPHLVTMLGDSEGVHVVVDRGFAVGRLSQLAKPVDAFRIVGGVSRG